MSRLSKEKFTTGKSKNKVPNFAYENKTTPLTKINVSQNGNDIYQMYLKNGDKKGFSRKEAYSAAKAFRLEIMAKYGSKFQLSVSVKNNGFGWRRGYSKSILEEVLLWSSAEGDTGGGVDDIDDGSEPDVIEAIAFYLIKTD
jgi:hypothetical protein